MAVLVEFVVEFIPFYRSTIETRSNSVSVWAGRASNIHNEFRLLFKQSCDVTHELWILYMPQTIIFHIGMHIYIRLTKIIVRVLFTMSVHCIAFWMELSKLLGQWIDIIASGSDDVSLNKRTLKMLL